MQQQQTKEVVQNRPHTRNSIVFHVFSSEKKKTYFCAILHRLVHNCNQCYNEYRQRKKKKRRVLIGKKSAKKKNNGRLMGFQLFFSSACIVWACRFEDIIQWCMHINKPGLFLEEQNRYNWIVFDEKFSLIFNSNGFFFSTNVWNQ